MIERLSEEMSVTLVGNKFWRTPSKISFTRENPVICPKFTNHLNTFLTLELSQRRKSASTFSSSEQVAASSACHRLGNTLTNKF